MWVIIIGGGVDDANNFMFTYINIMCRTLVYFHPANFHDKKLSHEKNNNNNNYCKKYFCTIKIKTCENIKYFPGLHPQLKWLGTVLHNYKKNV